MSVVMDQIQPAQENTFGNRRTVRIPEGADFLEIKVSTMKNLIRRGLVKSIKVGGSRRILVRSLLDIAENGTK